MKKIKFPSRELSNIILGASLFVIALVLDFVFEGTSLALLSTVTYILALLVSGYTVFFDAVRGILRRDLLDEKFLMCIASVGAMIIGDMSEGVAVMLFFLVGEYFEHKAVRKSRNSIRALMSIKPDEARLLKDGVEIMCDAEDVDVGSVILIKNGERIPIDCVVVSGSADIDTSALTGESLPRTAGEGSELESGCLLVNGYLVCRTLRLAEESAAARILELVENASENKSREENFITKFSRVYTPIVVLAAVLMAVIPPLFIDGYQFVDSLYSALTFLVISCPCALVISVPMAFFGGIGGAASKGILFKGGNIFNPLAKADAVAFDKTGTLTGGRFSVFRVEANGLGEDELLFYAASAEYGSIHPIAECIKKSVGEVTVPEKYEELPGMGVVAQVVSKRVAVGNSALLRTLGIETPKNESGEIFVAVNNEYAGRIFVSDEIKNGAEEAVSELKLLGIKRTVMLSGDRRINAERVGKALGIDEIESELLPEDKYRRLGEITEKSASTVYVGDGINDAPALVRADVGIAMGGIGSDSAIEAADVVIMNDDIAKIPLAIRIARKTLAIAKSNIIFALGVKLIILLLGVFGYANMWLAVFADVGVALLAILNSMRTLKIKS